MSSTQPRSGETMDDAAHRRRCVRMDKIDALEPTLRSLVHDYGFHLVNSFCQKNILEPRIIRHLIETTLDELSPTRGSSSVQGVTEKRYVTPKGCTIVPNEPTDEMLAASMEFMDQWRRSLTADERRLCERMINGRPVPSMSNREKHRRRYMAMLAVAPKR